MTANRRYGPLAPVYDIISGEWPIYRVGRIVGIRALQLRPGDTVLDTGCGTGLNHPLLREAVGPAGRIVGIDSSREMLDRSRARAARHGWANIEIVHADATTIGHATLNDLLSRGKRPESAVAVLFTYALSVMSDWPLAWRTGLSVCQPGEHLAVVDVAAPIGTAGIVFRPLARLAGYLGGADVDARPWRAVEEDCSNLQAWSLRRGHIQVRAGAKQERPPASAAQLTRP